jgi:hypothetical protein
VITTIAISRLKLACEGESPVNDRLFDPLSLLGPIASASVLSDTSTV